MGSRWGWTLLLADDAQYLVAALGLEGSPGAKWGWFAEAGVAGGVRLASGIQRRRRSRT